MVKIVDVRFKKAGKIYSFDTSGYEISPGKLVVVETSRGIELGTVLYEPRELSDEQIESPLKPVIRIATEADIQSKQNIRRMESEALSICRECAKQLALPMKCLRAEYNLDHTHITVYFSAEGRIDFRELVRELGRTLKVRVELRQIGPRDETKLLGGFGRCGREFCCANYLIEFDPVSIKMAKEQNLPLNPLKISGVCGRLLCCLNHEYETYKKLNAEMAECKACPQQGTNCEAKPSIKRPVTKEDVKIDIPPVTEDDDKQTLLSKTNEKNTKEKRPRRRNRRR